MEKKQGFFSALKDEVVRGLSPAKSRPKSRSRSESPAKSISPMFNLLLPRRRKSHTFSGHPEPLIARSVSFRSAGEALAPLMEGPDPFAADDFPGSSGDSRKEGWTQWVRGQLSRTHSVSSSAGVFRRYDLRLLLGVMGAPLVPIYANSLDPFPHLSIKDTPIERSSAQYILQQYMAASGGMKMQSSIRNAYAMGKVRMVAAEYETAKKVTRNRGSPVESGGFVLWKMALDLWYVELAVGGSKVRAGSNGRLVWRHTPWLGATLRGWAHTRPKALFVRFAALFRKILFMHYTYDADIIKTPSNMKPMCTNM